MASPTDSDDIRSDWQRLVDEGLLPNPNSASVAHAMTPAHQDPRISLDRYAIDRLAEQVVEYRDLSEMIRQRLVAVDRQLMRAQNLLRYIHREGVGALGDAEQAAFEYALGEAQ